MDDKQKAAHAAIDAMGVAETKRACALQGINATSRAISSGERKRLLRQAAALPDPAAASATDDEFIRDIVFDKVQTH